MPPAANAEDRRRISAPNNAGNILDVYKNASYPKNSGGDRDYNREHTWPKSYGFPDNSGDDESVFGNSVVLCVVSTCIVENHPPVPRDGCEGSPRPLREDARALLPEH